MKISNELTLSSVVKEAYL